jgi:hypothetical protein
MTFRGDRKKSSSPETGRPTDKSCHRQQGRQRDLQGHAGSVNPAACLPVVPSKSLHCSPMSVPPQPNIKLTNSPEYRENYANSVQMRVNVWDFFLVFGTVQQQSESQVEIRNFQGIYLSPQQAKALLGLLQQNVNGYETAFGEIKLDPRMSPGGQVH